MKELGNGQLGLLFEAGSMMTISRAGDGIIDQYDIQKIQKIVNLTNYDFTYNVETILNTTPLTGNAEYSNISSGYTLLTVKYRDSSKDKIKLDSGGNIKEFTVVDRYGQSVKKTINSSNSKETGDGIEITAFPEYKIIVNMTNKAITSIERVKKIDVVYEDIKRGYKQDANGNVLLDTNGQPVPNDTAIATKRISNAIILRADVNRDGYVTKEDKDVIQGVLDKALDVNGDGDISDLDFENIAGVVEAIKKNLTEDDIRKADIDLDGDIDADDIEQFERLFGVLSRADIDGLDGATQKDVDYIKGVFQFAARSEEIIPLAEIEMADVSGDGRVDKADRVMLLDVLEKLKDVNGDGTVDSDDAARILDIVKAQSLGVDLTMDDIRKADLDGDGEWNAEDTTLLAEARAAYARPLVEGYHPLDVNRDHLINSDDIAELQTIYSSLPKDEALDMSKLAIYDVNTDGALNQVDLDDMRKVLKGYIDVNGDGVIDGDDDTFMKMVIEYQKFGVTDHERAISDLNGDGRVTPDDEFRMSQLIKVYEKGDVDGDLEITTKDLEELNYILSYLENVQTYLPEDVEKADINKDGIVNKNDIDQLSMLIGHSVDVDNSGKVDSFDVTLVYDIIEALKHGMDRVSDLGLDLTPETAAIMTQAINVFSNTDINGDGIVNYHDIELFESVIMLMDVKGAVYDEDLAGADLNNDGTVDINDYNIVNAAKDSITIITDGSATDAVNGRFGFQGVGSTVYSRENGSYVKYKVTTVSTSNYDIQVDARGFNYQQPPYVGYKYEFELYVDNVFQGNMEIDATRDIYKTGSMNMDLGPGEHSIQLVWVNAPSNNSASVQIGEFRMVNTRDIDGSGMVTILDRKQINDVWTGFKIIDLDGSGHFDINDKEYLESRVALFDVNSDGKVGRGEGGVDDAEFNTLNISHVLEPTQADDDLIDANDVTQFENIMLSIYQVSRLKQSDIASRNPDGSLSYTPDGLITEADVAAGEILCQGYVDVNNDGIVDDQDEAYIQSIINFNRYSVSEDEFAAADLDKSGTIDEEDRKALQKNLALFDELDINGDLVTDEKDLALIVSIFKMFEIDKDTISRADINGDDIIDVQDKLALTRALKFGLDINGDLQWNGADIAIMSSVVSTNVDRLGLDPPLEAIYVEQLDITGLNADGTYSYEKDGIVDISDLALLRKSISERRDINSDGMVDIIDVNLASIDASVYTYDKALFNGKYSSITQQNLDELKSIITKYDVNLDDKVSSADIDIIMEIADIVRNRDLSQGTITEEAILKAIGNLPVLQPSDGTMTAPVKMVDKLTAQGSSLWEPVSRAWTTEGGIFTQGDARISGYARAGGTKAWEDIDISTKIKFDSYYKGAGVIFRATDLGNGYRVVLGDETIALEVLVNNEIKKREIVQVGTKLLKDTWYNLRVTADGNTFKVYLDGTLKMSYTDTQKNYTKGDLFLYTDHTSAAFKETTLIAECDLSYVRDKGLLGYDLTGSGGVTDADYALLDAITQLSARDVNGDNVINADDKTTLAHISNILQFTSGEDLLGNMQQIAASVMDTYDIDDSATIDIDDVNETERMKDFTDTVQRSTLGSLDNLDFADADGINDKDRRWVVQRFQRYLDINGDGAVNSDDLLRIQNLAKAQLLVKSVWPDIDDNQLIQDHVKELIDYDGNGVVDKKDLGLLEMIVDYYRKVDVNGDQLIGGADLSKLQSVLGLLYQVGQINPAEIIKVDLVGQYNTLTNEYAQADGKIDENDLKKALEILNSLYDPGADGEISDAEASAVWGDLSKMFRIGIEATKFENADLNGSGGVDGDDITMFKNNAGTYLRTDVNGDGFVDDRDFEKLMAFIEDAYQKIAYTESERALADLDHDGTVDSDDVVLAGRYQYYLGNGITRAVMEDIIYTGRLAGLSIPSGVTSSDITAVTAAIGAKSIVKDALDYYETNASSVSLSLISDLSGGYFNYDMDVAGYGKYDIGLTVRNYDNADYGKDYKLAVWIDGDYYGDVVIKADRSRMNEGFIRADLSKGVHFVEFRTVSDSADAGHKIQVGKVFVKASADINEDGIVNGDDTTIAGSIKARLDASTHAVMNGNFNKTLVDLNYDGLYDTKDMAMFLEAYNIMPAGMNANKVSEIAQGVKLFGEQTYEKADLLGDGTVDTKDMAIIRMALIRLYYQLDVSPEEKALSDINGDGKIDAADIKLLQDSIDNYGKADINGDGVVSRLDTELLNGMFKTAYSSPILTLDMGGFGGTIARADITGPVDANNDGIPDKDGVIDITDKQKLQAAIDHYSDIDQDGDFDQADRQWLVDVLTFSLVLETKDVPDSQLQGIDLNHDGEVDDVDGTWAERIIFMRGERHDMLPGISMSSKEIFDFLAEKGVVSIDYQSVASEIIHTSFNTEPEGQATYETGAESFEPQYMPGWQYNIEHNKYVYNGPRYASVIPSWEAKGEPGKWIIEDGKLRQKFVKTGTFTSVPAAKLEAKNVNFSNGVIEFDSFVASTAKASAGIEFRAKTDKDYYTVLMEKESEASGWTAKIGKVVNGVFTTLAQASVNVIENSWNAFRIYAVGGTIKVRVNSQPVFDVNDTGDIIEDGGIRLVSKPLCETAFDELKVESYVYEQGLAASEVITNNNFSDWTPFNDNGNWEMSYDGNYVTQKRSDGLTHLTQMAGDGYGDITASAEIKFDDNTDSKGGLIFRADENMENYYELTMDAKAGRIYLARVDDMTYERIAYEQIPIQKNLWYQVKVKAIGEHIEVYVNGKKLFNAVDTQFDPNAVGKVALFTSARTRASFKSLDVRKIIPFDNMLNELTGDEYNLVRKLNTLSRSKDFDGNIKIDSQDRLLFEIIGSGDYSLTAGGVAGVNMQLLNDVSSSLNLTQLNPDTNVILGDVNSDAKVDQRDVDLIGKLMDLTDNANAGHYIEDVLGLDQSNLHVLAAKDSSPYLKQALNNSSYEFYDLEALLRIADLDGNGSVNYMDSKLLVENREFYEFVLTLKTNMENLEFIPKNTYKNLSLVNFQSWAPELKQTFLDRLNAYLKTMDSTNGIKFRDYNGDGKVDFKDKYIFQHYADFTVEESEILNSINYGLRDIDGDEKSLINVDKDGHSDLEMIHKLIDLTHDAITPDELANADIDRNGTIEEADIDMYREYSKYYVDLDGQAGVNNLDLLKMNEYILRKQLVDVNLDNVVNQGDFTAVTALLGFQDAAYDVKKTLRGGDASVAKDIQITLDGNYRIGIFARANETKAGAIQKGYVFKYELLVNGVSKGTFNVDPATSNLAYGSVNAALGKGGYTVTLRWLNPVTGVESYLDNVLVSSAANLNRNGSVDLADIELLSKLINAEISNGLSYDERMDLSKDGLIDWNDYALFQDAIRIMKDVNGSGQVDGDDITDMENIIRLQENLDFYKSIDLDKNNVIEQHDIDIINTVRMLDIDADTIVRSGIASDRLNFEDLNQMLYELNKSDNKDYMLLGVMSDLELTINLFNQLDRNNDGVFDILDLPEGIDPTKFQDYNVYREGGDQDVLSYLDDNLIEKSIANLLFINKYDEAAQEKADVNHDGVIDFNDYEMLSEAYKLLYEGGNRDINLSGGLPDASDLEELRKIAVIMTESDINGDGNRNVSDRAIILGAMSTVSAEYKTTDSKQGFTLEEDGSLAARKTLGVNNYTLTYKMNVPAAGHYNVGLSARSQKARTMPVSGVYTVGVSVNGVYKGKIRILGSENQYNEGSADIYFDTDEIGEDVEVTFTWENAEYRYEDLDRDGYAYEKIDQYGKVIESDLDEKISCTMQVKNASISSRKFDDRADLTRDGSVDSKDIEAFEEAAMLYAQYMRSDLNGDGKIDISDTNIFNKGLVVSNTIASQTVNIGGQLYDVSYNKDLDTYTVDGNTTEMGEKTIVIGSKKYLILEDIHGEVRFVEKQVSDLTGGDRHPGPDGEVDLEDWSLICDSLNVKPIRISGVNYSSSGTGGQSEYAAGEGYMEGMSPVKVEGGMAVITKPSTYVDISYRF
ncbi:MAG: DUF1080 domain-containing protein, partial [Candidatus Omnitrophica bacterium]|nr:DUF1080 domain-containing protein [Candidatus Omnitrophota bacterium]